MRPDRWEDWIVSHACVVVSLAIVSLGMYVLGMRLMGDWIVLFIAAMWLFAVGVYSAFSKAFTKLGEKLAASQREQPTS